MRVFSSGYGMAPELESDALHAWSLDEASGNALDLLGTQNLTATNAPGASADSPIGGCRTFASASSQYFVGSSAGTDADVMGGAEWTLGAVFKLSSAHTAGSVVSYAESGESAATNVLGRIKVDSNRNVQIFWEHTSGSNVVSLVDNVTLEIGRWYQVLAAFDTDTLSVYINGVLAKTFTGLTGPSHSGGTQKWTIGGDLSGGAAEYWNGSIAWVWVHSTCKTADYAARQFRRMMLWSCASHVAIRADVEDGDGDMVCLNDYLGHDWVNGVTMRDDVDALFAEATLSVQREINGLSLSLFHDNRANRIEPDAEGPDASTYTEGAELLGIGRDVDLYVLRLPLGISPPAYDSTRWQHIFDGVTRKVDWGGDVVTVSCYDWGSEMERAYLLDPQQVGSASPGTPLEDALQDVLDAAHAAGWIPAAVTLSNKMPAASAWSVIGDESTGINDGALLTSLNTLAEMNACRVRVRWNPATDAFELTLYEPPRDKTIADWKLTPEDYTDIPNLSIDLTTIRTLVKGGYVPDAGEEASEPTPPTGTTLENWTAPGQVATISVRANGTGGLPDTVDLYGTIGCAITMSATDQISTITEADRFIRSVLKDLCRPTAEKGVDCFAFPELELDDMGAWEANGHHTTGTLTLALTGIDHAFGDGDSGTSLMLRGSPSGGSRRHLRKEARGGNALPPPSSSDQLAIGLPFSVRMAAIWELLNNTQMARPPKRGSLFNPHFEDRVFRQMPDGWNQVIGTYGTDVIVDTTTVKSGRHSIKMITTTANIRSDPVPVESGAILEADLMWKVSSVGATAPELSARVYFYDETDTLLPFPDTSTEVIAGVATATDWKRSRGYVVVPADARYARLNVDRDVMGTGSPTMHIDRADLTPVKCSFLAYRSADQASGSTAPIQFDDEEYDIGGVYDDASTYEFTAPEDGFYEFSAGARYSDGGSGAYSLQLSLYKNDSAWITGAKVENASALSIRAGVSSGRRKLNKGDRIEVRASVDTPPDRTPQLEGGIADTWFSGQQLGD